MHFKPLANYSEQIKIQTVHINNKSYDALCKIFLKVKISHRWAKTCKTGRNNFCCLLNPRNIYNDCFIVHFKGSKLNLK